MRKVWPWLVGLIVVLVLGWIILSGTGFFQNGGYLPQSRFTQQGISLKNWHHHDFGLGWGMSFVGMLGGLLFLFIPGGLIALIILGVYLLARPNRKEESHRYGDSLGHCPNCGEKVEPGWHVCPYCSENLGKD